MNNIIVSIYCLAYNQEPYISQTIESLIKQKTRFSYEIIIHDDASTDRTAKIIKEYEKGYPNIIKAIYQKENQYSKDVDVVQKFVLPQISGKYVAICEGDDFWTDLDKLQKQVDALEKHQDCDMCVHGTKEIYENGEFTGVYYPSKENRKETGVISSYDFLKMGKHYSFHTTSYMFRTQKWKEFILDPPSFKTICDVGDETYMLYFGQLANVFYINEDMSCYRRGAMSSWSSQQAVSFEKQVAHYEAMVRTIREFDKYTNEKYRDICEVRISNYLKYIFLMTGRCKEFLKKGNKKYFNRYNLMLKIVLIVAMIMPNTAEKKYKKRVMEAYMKNGYL